MLKIASKVKLNGINLGSQYTWRNSKTLAATAKSVIKTTRASGWPWALGRPAVCEKGGVRETRFLRGQNRYECSEKKYQHDPMGLWIKKYRQTPNIHTHRPHICATDLS